MPSSATAIATGRATSSVIGDDRHRRPAVAEQAVERQQRAEDDEHAELDDLDDVVGALLEGVAQVVAADAERDRAHEHGDQPVALGRQRDRDAVGGERRAERVQRLLVRGDLAACAASATRPAGPCAIPKAKPSVTSWSTKCHHTKPSSSAATARKASTAGSASPSLSPDSRLSEWRTTRGTRGLVTTRGREHRVGRREQRADQEALGPAEVGQPVRGQRDDHAGQRHRHHELAQRQPPLRLQHLGLDLEPVAEQDHDQRDDRQVVHELAARVDLEHARARRRPAGSRRPRTPRSATGTSGWRARTRARRPSAGRRGSASPRRSSAAATTVTCNKVAHRGGSERARADHRAGEVPGLAGRRRRLLGLPRRGRRADRAARLRARRVRQAARATSTTRTSTRS